MAYSSIQAAGYTRRSAAFSGDTFAKGPSRFLRSLSISQWLIVLYPFMVFLVSRRRAADDFQVVDASAMIQIGYTCVCAIYLIHAFNSRGRILVAFLKAPPMIFLLLYGLLAAASSAWSPYRYLTLFRSFQFLVFLVLISDAILRARNWTFAVKFAVVFGVGLVLIGQIIWALRFGFALENFRSREVVQTSAILFFSFPRPFR